MKPTETLNTALFLKQALIMDPKTVGRLPAGLSDSISSRLPGQSLLSRYKELLTGSRSKSLSGLSDQVRANMDKMPAAVRERAMGNFTSPLDTALKNEKSKVLATRVGTGLGAAALGGGVALAAKKKKDKDKERD